MSFKSLWKKHYSKFRLFCVISTFVTILALVLSIVMALKYMPQGEDEPYGVEQGNSTLKINMTTQYIEVDAITGTMTVDWYPAAFDCADPAGVVNIYFDPYAHSSASSTRKFMSDLSNLLGGSVADLSNGLSGASDNPPDQPTFQFNATTSCLETLPNPQSSFPTFRTVAKLIRFQINSNSKFSGPSLQWYPMDTYVTVLRLFAQLNSTKASVGIDDISFGTPVNFNVVLDRELSSNTVAGLSLVFVVKRAIAVKVLVSFIVMANWIASVAFVWITIASFLWPETVVKEMFVVPIAALFAFTSVRSNMPGAPAGFGAFIDFIGILPNIALMAVCSATLLLVVLVRRTHHQENDPEQHKKQDPEQRQEQDSEQHREQDSEQHQEQVIEQRREQDTDQHQEQDIEQRREQDPAQHLERRTEQRREQDAEQHQEWDTELHHEQNTGQNPEQHQKKDPEGHQERDTEQCQKHDPKQGQDAEQKTMRAGESQDAMQPVSNETPNTRGTTINIVKAEEAPQDEPEMLLWELSRISMEN